MAVINHILVEAFCLKDNADVVKKDGVVICESGLQGPRYDCFLKNCPHFSFTSHENALCYVNDKSYTDPNLIVSLGGEMLPDGCDEEKARTLWEEIAARKIKEAYQEYMESLKLIK